MRNRPVLLVLALVAASTLVACSRAAPATPEPAPAGEPATPEPAPAGEPAPAPPAADVDWARAPSAPDPSARMEAGFFVADGAPSPAACTTDAECQGNTLPAEGGCCQDPTALGAYTTAYRSWLGTWRGAHCAGVTCPPAVVPTRPADCYFDVHCAAGACANTCRF